MKKLLGIVVLGLLFSGNAYAEDKFLGKWISNGTNSVFEIKKDKNEYKVYLLYSGRWFQKYENNQIGQFKKKNILYKGTIEYVDRDKNTFEVKASYKIKKGDLIIKGKGVSPFTDEKFNSKTIFKKFNDNDKYVEGESLFGIKIGDSIKNYKTLTKINLGNEMVGYIEGIVIKAPEPNSDFESYIVQIAKGTDQIYQIFAYLGANLQSLSYGECESLMQPYRNYIIEKYENDFFVRNDSGISDASSNTKTFSLLNRNTRVLIYKVWTTCDEPFSDSIGDKGQYIARISLLHEGLEKLGWANDRKKTKKKKKF
jgi:hypothetical protein